MVTAIEKPDAEVEKRWMEREEEQSVELGNLYSDLVDAICGELEAAGVKPGECEWDDGECWFTFDSEEDTEQFYELVEVVERPPAWDRECESVYIARTDLFAVYKQLVKCRMQSR